MLLWQATTWHGMLNVQSNFQWLPYSIHFPRSQFYTRESGRDWPLSAISTLPSPIFCKAFPPPSPRPWWSWACCFNSYCISFYQNLSLNGTFLERKPLLFQTVLSVKTVNSYIWERCFFWRVLFCTIIAFLMWSCTTGGGACFALHIPTLLLLLLLTKHTHRPPSGRVSQWGSTFVSTIVLQDFNFLWFPLLDKRPMWCDVLGASGAATSTDSCKIEIWNEW